MEEIDEVLLAENFAGPDSFSVNVKYTLNNFTEIIELVEEFSGDCMVDFEEFKIICIFKEYEQAYLFKLSAELL